MTEARYAVIGNPIAHSRSPQIHAMFARQTGRALRYDRLLAPLDGFVAATTAFVAEGGLGLNVTVPFKQEACALAAGNLSDRARLAGAVNTLSWRNGAWHGCNTDGVGLVSDLLRLGLRLDGARVLLVGAGGAARGVLRRWRRPAAPASISSTAPPPARSNWPRPGAPAGRPASPGHGRHARRGGNARRLGRGHQCHRQRASRCRPRPARRPVCPGALAYDMMYGAAPTAFMKQAGADGAARTADGLGMLVGQAAESFHIWHGLRPDPEPVLAALRADLAAGR